MSTISSTSLSQFFQSIAASAGSQASAPSSPVDATAADPSNSASVASTPPHGGHHHHGGGGKFAEIQSAVTNALQSTQSGSSTDPNQIIEQAIEKVLQGTSSSPATSATGADGASGTAAAPSSSQPTTAAPANSQTFFQTLQSMGVDPQQFHQDFMTAIQAVQQGGQPNPAMALASFPPGSGLDAIG
ncbi:MAG TPA: hypothetical protein VFC78_19885 [Tepidisphaeraceae bacterium]|nr:hypothetical protein [Tepidisphaeraceae bacterium]